MNTCEVPSREQLRTNLNLLRDQVKVDAAFALVANGKAPAPLDMTTPNFKAASMKVLQGAALVGVGKWLQDAANVKVASLERALVGLVKGTEPLAMVLYLGERLIDECFADINRQTWSHLESLGAILEKHSRKHLAECHDINCAGRHQHVSVTGMLVAGLTLKETLDKQADDLTARFKAQMRLGKQNDESAEQLAKRILGDPQAEANEVLRYIANADPFTTALGVAVRLLDASEGTFGKMIQSAVQVLAHEVETGLMDNEPDDEETGVKMGWLWVGVLDDRICEKCEFFDGQRWDGDYEPVNDGPEFPGYPQDAMHPNCRCQLVAVDLNAEPVPKNVKLDTFIKSFRPETRRAVWGDAAAGAYDRKDISAGELLNAGKPLSLDEFNEIESVMNQ